MSRKYTPSELYMGQRTAEQIAMLRELVLNPQLLRAGISPAELMECLKWFEARTDKMNHQIFTHRDMYGTFRHLDVTEMRFAVEEDPSIARFIEAYVSRSNYEHIVMHHGIEEPHVARLKNDDMRFMPLIWCEMGPNDQYQVLVDGGHRLVRNWRDGYKTARGWLFPKEVWSRYLVTFPEVLEKVSGRFIENAEEESRRQAEVHKTVLHR